MGAIDNSLKFKLETLFGMGTGYLLDFSNSTFADFVQTSIGFNPYDRFTGWILRSVRATVPFGGEPVFRVRVSSFEPDEVFGHGVVARFEAVACASVVIRSTIASASIFYTIRSCH